MYTHLLLVSPALGDRLEHLLLLGAGLIIFVVGLAICDVLFTIIPKILKAAFFSLFKATRRAEKKRPDPFERYATRLRRPPQSAGEDPHHRHTVVQAAQKKSAGRPHERSVSAQEAIRRSCRR